MKLKPMYWRPIKEAPKSQTPVVLLRAHEDLDCEGKVLVNYARVTMGRGNVFYEPLDHGECVVRDATHFMLMRDFAQILKPEVES